jgi:uncharacterized membrane protein
MVLISIAIVGAMLLVSALAWLQLPADARVPIHWGPDGQPDDWADKTLGLFLMPAIAAGVATLLAFVPRFEPRRTNLARSSKAYGATWIGVMLLLGGLHVLAVTVALGAELDLTRIVMVGTGVLFVVIGNYLPTVRPNYMMGIRTPWTLTSDVAWTRTHRIGGRLFVLIGIVIAILGLIGIDGMTLVWVLLGAIGILLVVTFAYSYQVWKTDPEKRTR